MSGEVRDHDDYSEKSPDGRIVLAYYVCWTCVVGSLIAGAIVIPSQSWLLLSGVFGVLTVGLVALWLLRRKRNQAAFRILALGAWLVVMAEPAVNNGLFSILLVTLPLVLSLSAWLLGARTAVWVGLATLPIIFGYAYLHLSGVIRADQALPVVPRALLLALIVAVAAALAYFAASVLRQQLGALDDAKRALENTVSKLAKRDEELSLLTESVPAMIARLDRNETYRFANSGYARFHGSTVENILGRHALEVIGERAYRDIEPGIGRVLAGESHQQLVSRRNEAGEERMLLSELVPDYGRDGRVEGWYALLRDVTESERANRALRHIVEGTSRATGAAFFRALTQNLAQATGMNLALMAELLPHQSWARALACWTGTAFSEDVEYALAGTPSQKVMESGEVCYPDRVAELFPEDPQLAAEGIRGYWGMRLDAQDGTALGLLAVMDRAPFNQRDQLASLVSVFAARAAAELERMRAERAQHLALERFRAIFQHTPNVAIQGFDATGKVMHWNRASERMYGVAESEALGQPIQRILQTPETDLEFDAQLAAICQSGQPTEPAEWPILLRDGRQIWVLSTMFPVFAQDEPVEIFCMDIDITALKEATREAQEVNTALEARVAERTAELADLNRELEAFSYSVSHDLRAPLRSIQGFGSILEERYGQQLDEMARDHLQRMIRAAQRLAQLIDDLLQLTRINRAEMHWVEVDLSALAREIIEEIRHGAPQRQAELRIEDGLVTRGDPQLLRVAMQNLLDNAWKYTAKVPRACIEFNRNRDTGEIVYVVRDNGAGFDMAYADKLFVPFQRLHNPRDFEGTGIGLATVARVVHRHGGRVWANSKPGQGAEFFFTLGR